LYGRYIKDKRGLPQKKKSCIDCKGKGCIFCNNHGIVSFDSVEGKISQLLYEKFETKQAVQFTINYDPKKLEKFIAFALIAMVQSNIKKIKKEIETSFGDNFWQVPVTAKELLVLFMYSDNIYNADVMRHKIKEIDGVAFTEVFFPKKITMPTNWISNSIKNASKSERLHVPIKQINR